ncbi:MAG: hypothetical protein ICV83_04980 [Cytophagales bacterium]|nr:hypothetical protein [Cytophagales bacterium]
MKICGLKLTHDGAIALIDDGKLVFSIEMEKLNNNSRYSSVDNTAIIEELLNRYGYSLDQIDEFVIDGWEGLDTSLINTGNQGSPYALEVAPYREKKPSQDVLHRYSFGGLKVGSRVLNYSSYMHVSGHIFSAYCTSPFARRKESSYVLVWDGGMFPRLYYFDVRTNKVENLGKVIYLIGNFYSEFSMYFEPFKFQKKGEKEELSVAGKVMAYIAKGTVRTEILEEFEFIFNNHLNIGLEYVHEFARMFKQRNPNAKFKDEDVLASMHVFLEKLLIEGLREKVKKQPTYSRNICFVGGCALNIKWNSAIRNTGIFREVWVPPFPNDSGSAIGAACCAMINRSSRVEVDWTVYCGPEIIVNDPPEGWTRKDFTVQELAVLLHETNEPVVFLNGAAETGPRALGNRSILAAAVSPRMKNLLNEIKNREDYRPVAPICMEDKTADVFIPGIRDPYMLFDHFVKEEWKDRVPAICHLDGTARVQTVSPEDNILIYALLAAYHELSGVPLLCNTSANFNGKGFFPDLVSVIEWGKVNYVWCDNKLYAKQGAVHSLADKAEATPVYTL